MAEIKYFKSEDGEVFIKQVDESYIASSLLVDGETESSYGATVVVDEKTEMEAFTEITQDDYEAGMEKILYYLDLAKP